MKTLFVINSLEGGGAERALVRLVDAMASCSWFSEKEIHLVLLDKKPIEQEIPSEVVVHQLDSKGGFISSLKGLGRKVEEIKPEVMVSYLTRSNIASSLLSKFYSVPLIISERVNTSSHFIGGAAFLYKAMVKYLYPFANKIVAVSDGVKSDLVDNFGIDPEKVVVINNGYSKLELEKSASDSESIEMPKNSYAVAVGRLVPNKNMRLLIQAHAEGNYDFDLLILGDGPDRDELEAYARALNDLRNGQVYFKGFVRNPYPYIKGALFYVSSSNAEGFPNALVESMVLGKAVLSTNCPWVLLKY